MKIEEQLLIQGPLVPFDIVAIAICCARYVWYLRRATRRMLLASQDSTDLMWIVAQWVLWHSSHVLKLAILTKGLRVLESFRYIWSGIVVSVQIIFSLCFLWFFAGGVNFIIVLFGNLLLFCFVKRFGRVVGRSTLQVFVSFSIATLITRPVALIFLFRLLTFRSYDRFFFTSPAALVIRPITSTSVLFIVSWMRGCVTYSHWDVSSWT